MSALLGFAYGNMFALLPILVLEMFGLAHYAQNWGMVALSPVVGGNLANYLFGKIFDSHTVSGCLRLQGENLLTGFG